MIYKISDHFNSPYAKSKVLLETLKYDTNKSCSYGSKLQFSIRYLILPINLHRERKLLRLTILFDIFE